MESTSLPTSSLSPAFALSLDMNDDEELPLTSTLSDTQDRALSLTPLFSGLLSAWGSANIIYLVLWAPSRSTMSCYKSIMLGLSFFDFVSSITISLHAFLLPKETSDAIYAVGNDTTCTIMGFLQQISIASIWYNGFLSVFFLLTIKYGIPEGIRLRRIIRGFHAIAIGHPLVTAIAGVELGAFSEMDVGHACWLNQYPAGCISCQDDPILLEGQYCCKTPLLVYLFAAIPTFLVLIALVINNILIYCHLRNVVRNYQQGDEQASTEDSSPASDRQTEDASSNRQRQKEEALQRQYQKEQESRQQGRLQSAAFQAFLYVGGFLLTQLPTIIMGAMATGTEYTTEDGDYLFPILLLRAILWPLQGLFNYFIYMMPSYLSET